MAKKAVKKQAKTVSKKTTNSKNDFDISSAALVFSAAVLFAGILVILLANIQDFSNIRLMLVGFGAALLVVGGSLLAVAFQKFK